VGESKDEGARASKSEREKDIAREQESVYATTSVVAMESMYRRVFTFKIVFSSSSILF